MNTDMVSGVVKRLRDHGHMVMVDGVEIGVGDVIERQAAVIDKADALADVAGRVSEWDAWAYTYGGVCPDHLIGCLDNMRAAIAAYRGVK